METPSKVPTGLVDPSGELIDTAVAEEAFLIDAVGSPRIAVTDGSLVISQGMDVEGVSKAVLVAPLRGDHPVERGDRFPGRARG